MQMIDIKRLQIQVADDIEQVVSICPEIIVDFHAVRKGSVNSANVWLMCKHHHHKRITELIAHHKCLYEGFIRISVNNANQGQI